jgi:hypothetical protein
MHPELDYLYSSLLREARERKAEHERLAWVAGRRSHARVPWIWTARQRVGYLLVEAGLRLALSPAPSSR